MKNNINLIRKIIVSNFKLFTVLGIGMVLGNIYIEYCIYSFLINIDMPLLKVLGFNYIYTLITFIFMLSYGFILREIMVEHNFDLYVIMMCGEQKKRLAKKLFSYIMCVWLKCFIFSILLFVCLLYIFSQDIVNIILVAILSFLISSVLNAIICGLHIRKYIVNYNFTEELNI